VAIDAHQQVAARYSLLDDDTNKNTIKSARMINAQMTACHSASAFFSVYSFSQLPHTHTTVSQQIFSQTMRRVRVDTLMTCFENVFTRMPPLEELTDKTGISQIVIQTYIAKQTPFVSLVILNHSYLKNCQKCVGK
jgi:hypothetical protein